MIPIPSSPTIYPMSHEINDSPSKVRKRTAADAAIRTWHSTYGQNDKEPPAKFFRKLSSLSKTAILAQMTGLQNEMQEILKNKLLPTDQIVKDTLSISRDLKNIDRDTARNFVDLYAQVIKRPKIPPSIQKDSEKIFSNFESHLYDYGVRIFKRGRETEPKLHFLRYSDSPVKVYTAEEHLLISFRSHLESICEAIIRENTKLNSSRDAIWGSFLYYQEITELLYDICGSLLPDLWDEIDALRQDQRDFFKTSQRLKELFLKKIDTCSHWPSDDDYPSILIKPAEKEALKQFVQFIWQEASFQELLASYWDAEEAKIPLPPKTISPVKKPLHHILKSIPTTTSHAIY